MKPDCTKYDAIIFDLFHTLIDLSHVPPSVRAWEYLGITLPDWSRALFSDAERRLRGDISDHGEVVRDITCKLVPDIPNQRIEHAARLREQQFRAALSEVRPHVMSTVRELKLRGKLLGLISNADRIEASSWEQTDIAQYFDCAVFSCQVGYVKPEREIYSVTLERLGLLPGQCLFVGDGGNDELEGAKRTGMATAIALEFVPDQSAPKVRSRREQADFELQRIDELLQ